MAEPPNIHTYIPRDENSVFIGEQIYVVQSLQHTYTPIDATSVLINGNVYVLQSSIGGTMQHIYYPRDEHSVMIDGVPYFKSSYAAMPAFFSAAAGFGQSTVHSPFPTALQNTYCSTMRNFDELKLTIPRSQQSHSQ